MMNDPSVVEILQIIPAPQGLVVEVDTKGNYWPIVCLALVKDKQDGENFVMPMDMSEDGDIQLLFLGDKNTIKVFIKNSQEEHNGRQSKEG